MGATHRLTWLLSASLAVFSAIGTARAQQSPPPPSPLAAEAHSSDDEDNNDDIVVLAQPGYQVRIDRRTYTLSEDPVAQSTNMFDVLGRIPSVSVAPSGEITLLGASNVTIQINGQPVQGQNLEQILRGLPGSSVERIEVITNPSAQYAADASGGIINIITRQRFDAGLSGNLQTQLDSLGNYHVGVAPSWSQGRWSFSGHAGAFGGGQDNDITRERQDLPAGPLTTETGQRSFEYEGWYLSQLQASYRPTDRQRMSLSVGTGQFNFEQEQASQLADAGGPIADTGSQTESENQNGQLIFDFQQDGDAPREATKFNAALTNSENESETVFSIAPAGGGPTTSYATRSAQDTTSAKIKFDFEQPLPDDAFLTLGASFDYADQTFENSLQALTGAAPPAYDATLDGVSQTLATYATFQFKTGDWTWLPGLRAENYRREVTSGGLETDDGDTRVFASLHIRRELTRDINVDLSYSSRIARPGVSQLDPALRFIDVNRAFSGNPNLEPSTTDAYEANFVYQKSGRSFSVTFFDRISEDVFSNFTDVNGDGVIVSMPVNAGTSEQRGVQALLRGPLGERWRYSLSANALNREHDFLSGGVITRRSEFEYDGIVQLDYRDPDQEQVGADQLQFEVRFQGPRHGLQSETDEFVMVNFTWRRRLTSRLFSVLTVQDIFDSTGQISEITTDDYVERTEFESAGTRLRLSLTYQFGSGPQRPPPDELGGPPIPSGP